MLVAVAGVSSVLAVLPDEHRLTLQALQAELDALQARLDPSRPPPTSGAGATKPPYATDRFIVKFKPSLTQCADCLFEKKLPLATALTDLSDSLDQLNQQARVIAIEPLFPQWHRLLTSDSLLAYRQTLADSRRRFPDRTQRIPPGAVLPDLVNI
jgi:hypothetical protein